MVPTVRRPMRNTQTGTTHITMNLEVVRLVPVRIPTVFVLHRAL